MFEKFLCPECKGTGWEEEPFDDGRSSYKVPGVTCFYCNGTGYATDEDGDDPMYSYDKGN